MAKIEIRLPFVQYDDPGLVCPEPTLTQQNFAEECDYNAIMSKWQRGVEPTHLNPLNPQYADVSSIEDYQTAMNTVLQAEAAFNALPAKIRERFQNDPAEFVAFVSNDDNYTEAVNLGLVPAGDAKRPQGAGEAAPAEAAPAA